MINLHFLHQRLSGEHMQAVLPNREGKSLPSPTLAFGDRQLGSSRQLTQFERRTPLKSHLPHQLRGEIDHSNCSYSKTSEKQID